jgi:Domain of Unknown Function (DUF1206)
MAARSRGGKVAWLARSGYAARGVVYLIVGGLAVVAALGGGRTTDSKGALRTTLQQPFGEALLALVALGLVGYAIWRLVQATTDPDGHGTDVKGGHRAHPSRGVGTHPAQRLFRRPCGVRLVKAPGNARSEIRDTGRAGRPGRIPAELLGEIPSVPGPKMVPRGGIEPPTRGFSVRCSTD